MNARHAALLALSVLVASPAWLAAQEDLSGPHGLERLLPAKPELQVTRPESGDPLFTLRGRDLPAAEFLALLAARGETQILIDDAAAEPLRTTIISIDLHERRADFTIDLIAAAADRKSVV